jgi:hypothetical protein
VASIVDADEDKVEADLLAGLLACPGCNGELGPWGHSVSREVWRLTGSIWLRPRRSMCRVCKKSHVLLPESTLIRRRDHVEVIGTALVMRAWGASIARIAAELARLIGTVRGWLRAFAVQAEAIRALFTRWARVLDPGGEPIPPAGSAFCDALAAIGVASRAAVLRFGARPAWSNLSRLSGGALLCNTRLLYRSMPIA